jgi:hypothetical protein
MKNHWLDRKIELESKINLSIWDFETALGDTIREKYESKYVKVIEVNDVVNRRLIPCMFPKYSYDVS